MNPSLRFLKSPTTPSQFNAFWWETNKKFIKSLRACYNFQHFLLFTFWGRKVRKVVSTSLDIWDLRPSPCYVTHKRVSNETLFCHGYFYIPTSKIRFQNFGDWIKDRLKTFDSRSRRTILSHKKKYRKERLDIFSVYADINDLKEFLYLETMSSPTINLKKSFEN